MAPCADADDERVLTWTNKPVEFPVPKISFGLNEAAELLNQIQGYADYRSERLEELLETFLNEHDSANS